MDSSGDSSEQPTGDLAAGKEEQIEISPENRQKSTLVEKLVASQKYPKKGTADSSANAAESLRNMETSEKTESGYFDRVGRRLQTMLDAV